jgi:hypothetical protein
MSDKQRMSRSESCLEFGAKRLVKRTREEAMERILGKKIENVLVCLLPNNIALINKRKQEGKGTLPRQKS